MTMDRDVRLTPEQITYLKRLCGNRLRELRRKIARADESRRQGNTVQLGTLQHHHTEYEALQQVADSLEVARQQIVRHIEAKLGLVS